MVNKKIILLIFIGALIILGIYLSLNQERPTNTNINDVTNKPAPVDIKTEVVPNPNTKSLMGGYKLLANNNQTIFTPTELPATLPVYQYTPSAFMTQENIAKLSNYFKFGELKQTISPVQGEILFASNEIGSISGELANHKLTLNFYAPSADTSTTFEGLEAEIFIERAKEILQNQIGLNPDKYPNVKYIYVFYQVVRWKPVNEPSSANRIQVLFESATPNKYPLVDKNFSATPNIARVTLNPQGNPVEIYIEDSGEIKQTAGDLPIKSKETVLKELNEGKAKIINTNTISEATEEVEILVREVNLSYAKEKNTLIPVFVAIGSAVFKDPNNLSGLSEIEMLLPATY
jgi:hypothetical protein